MELYVILESVLLVIGNLVLKVSVASRLEWRIAYILCIFLLVYPILSQLRFRRIKKTLPVLLAAIAAAGSLVGIAVAIFVGVPDLYVFIFWALFFLSHAIQNISIFRHCKRIKNIRNTRKYRIGLALLAFEILADVAVIAQLAYWTVMQESMQWLPLLSSVGIICHAVGVFGVLLMRVSSVSPVRKEALYR